VKLVAVEEEGVEEEHQGKRRRREWGMRKLPSCAVKQIDRSTMDARYYYNSCARLLL